MQNTSKLGSTQLERASIADARGEAMRNVSTPPHLPAAVNAIEMAQSLCKRLHDAAALLEQAAEQLFGTSPETLGGNCSAPAPDGVLGHIVGSLKSGHDAASRIEAVLGRFGREMP